MVMTGQCDRQHLSELSYVDFCVIVWFIVMITTVKFECIHSTLITLHRELHNQKLTNVHYHYLIIPNIPLPHTSLDIKPFLSPPPLKKEENNSSIHIISPTLHTVCLIPLVLFAVHVWQAQDDLFRKIS